MNKKIHYQLLVIIAITLSSCSIHQKIVKEKSTKNPEINTQSTGVMLKPIIADLEISNTKKSVVYKADLSIVPSELNNNAMQLFLDSHQCDYIVDPQFSRKTITKNSTIVEIEITVKGFPAKYKKFYQVDSIPKSVIQYSNVTLNAKRSEFNSSFSETISGSTFGIEAYGGGGFVGAQIDYGKINGLHFYLSTELHSLTSNLGTIKFSETINNTSINRDAKFSTFNNISMGVFGEKKVGRRIKIRASGGLNFLSSQFDSPIINTVAKSEYTGVREFGVRLGGAVDYSIFTGLSVIGRFHTNLGLSKSIIQNGENTYATDILELNNIPLINLGVGLRLSF
jgi:hypothetical protein